MCRAHATLYKFCACPGSIVIHPCSHPSSSNNSCATALSSQLTHLPIIELHCYCDAHSTQSFTTARNHRKKVERVESRERKVKEREESRQRKEDRSRRELEECARRMRGRDGVGGETLEEQQGPQEVEEEVEMRKKPRRRLTRALFADKDKERSLGKDKRRYTRLSFDGKDRGGDDGRCVVI